MQKLLQRFGVKPLHVFENVVNEKVRFSTNHSIKLL